MNLKFSFFVYLICCFSSLLIAQNPDWKVNSANFSLDASIIAELQIDNEGFPDIKDIVAAFDENNQIRGVANVTYIPALSKYFVFLTINGNTGGDILSFKVYDDSQNKILDVPKIKIDFIPNQITGSAEEPFLIKAFSKFLPTTKTYLAKNITLNTAILQGEILSKGKSDELTERGFVLSSEDSYPELNQTSTTTIVAGNTIGSFSHNITNINTERNIYFYRAYATNSFGTTYGDVKRFSLNNALNFDGTDDFLSITDNTAFNFSNGFSVDALVNPTNFDDASSLISQFSDAQKAISISVNTGGVITASFSVDGVTETSAKSNLRLRLNQWQHLAVTYNNGSIKIYIDGTEDVTAFTTNATIGAIFNSTASIQIGAKNATDFFNCTIDELRIWNKPLTSTTINTIKNKTIPKHINGLIGYYNFNQGLSEGDNSTISQVFDKTDSALNATLNNFAKSGNNSNFVNGITRNFDNTKVAQNTFTTTGNWSNPNNWSFGSVPEKVDRVVVKENQEITIDVSNLEIDELVLENNATLKIPKNKAIIINNQFDSTGNLELDSDADDSGVLLVNGETTGTVTYKRGGLLANKWSIVTPPVSGQKVKSFIENTANDIRVNTTVNPNRYAIAYYDDSKSSANKWVYYTENLSAIEEFTAGKSYSMSRATDGEVTFVGSLAVDDLKRTLVAGQWNAIGNPFTTYYPANKNSNSSFIKDNFAVLDDTFKSLYIWNNLQNKYVAVTEVSEFAKSLPPGQGFFIKLKENENEIHFHKDKRSTKPETGNSTFEKRNSSVPTIGITAQLNKTRVTTEIKFFENATLGLDVGLDIGNFNSTGLDVYTKLINSENNTNFTIQSLPTTKYDDLKIPLGIQGKKGNIITITANKTNLPKDFTVYLEDTLTDSFINLSDENANYQFTLINDLNDVGRFYIHTASSILSTIDTNIKPLSVFSSEKKLIINGLQDENSVLQLYTISGKKIYQEKLSSVNQQEINLDAVSSGIYFINIKGQKNNFTKKIIFD